MKTLNVYETEQVAGGVWGTVLKKAIEKVTSKLSRKNRKRVERTAEQGGLGYETAQMTGSTSNDSSPDCYNTETQCICD